MAKITPDIIKNIIVKDGNLYVPESICKAVGSCIVSDFATIQKEGARLKELYESYQRKMEPIEISYVGDATIDAYSIYYLPRNTLVPKIALLCCAYHPAFQNLPKRLRVLDLGSGTGGVVIGLLDLFHNDPFSKISLDITAVDLSPDSLQRQRQLVNCVGLSDSMWRRIEADLTDPEDYRPKLWSGAPYDMVFAANIFTELDEPATDALLQNVAPLLAQNGILVNVEATREYTGRQLIHITKNSKELGLNIYYPCPPDFPCPKPKCWMWRKDRFECPNISVGNKPIETTPVQKAYWLILCKKPCSIYDVLRQKNPKLSWGVAARIGKERTDENKREQDYEICTVNGLKSITHTRKKQDLFWILDGERFKRGSIIGSTDDYSEVETWDILSGFTSYKSDEI